VNSEELEQSLRTEFEGYLKNVLADMRREVSEFQKKFEAEFEKHKSQLDEVFQDFSARVGTDQALDPNFSETVVEHLRLARDEGARITATAIAEAEELEKEKSVAASAPQMNFGEIRDAINDISSKNTQSAILKSLVQQAAQFTPRGAFFIIKNEHLVGWRVFGKEGAVDEQIVREVFFSVATETVLGEAVRSLTTVESSYGTFSEDRSFLEKLEFGHPERMYAIPLVVRGRAVAVLYADYGAENEDVNLEALETLVRVASLTVEVLASSRAAHPAAEVHAVVPAEETTATYHQFEEKSETAFDSQSQFTEPVAEAKEIVEEPAAEIVPEPDYAYQFASPEVEQIPVADETEEASYVSTPFEEPAEPYAAAGYPTVIESDSFAFKPRFQADEPGRQYTSETASYSFEENPVRYEAAAGEEYRASDETPVPTFESESAWDQPVAIEDFYTQPSSSAFETPSYETPSYEAPSYETSSFEAAEPQSFETVPLEAQSEVEGSEYAPALNGDYQFEGAQTDETPVRFEESPSSGFATPKFEAENFSATNGHDYSSNHSENGKSESYAAAEPAQAISEPAAQPTRSRFSERNVDLPIDVSEDERRLHNDARRFARLLVSEIKLYNEQKVREGREASDLYDRLREAIDRSREMYDKRVQAPVAAKFDYFHYELVSNLAEADETKLGSSYPGAAI
jgi:hypothetical protein